MMSDGKKQQCEMSMKTLKDITTSWAQMAEKERALREHLMGFTSTETQEIIDRILENEKQRARDFSQLLNFISVECYLED